VATGVRSAAARQQFVTIIRSGCRYIGSIIRPGCGHGRRCEARAQIDTAGHLQPRRRERGHDEDDGNVAVAACLVPACRAATCARPTIIHWPRFPSDVSQLKCPRPQAVGRSRPLAPSRSWPWRWPCRGIRRAHVRGPRRGAPARNRNLAPNTGGRYGGGRARGTADGAASHTLSTHACPAPRFTLPMVCVWYR
jgi:hypothetical protein